MKPNWLVVFAIAGVVFLGAVGLTSNKPAPASIVDPFDAAPVASAASPAEPAIVDPFDKPATVPAADQIDEINADLARNRQREKDAEQTAKAIADELERRR